MCSTVSRGLTCLSLSNSCIPSPTLRRAVMVQLTPTDCKANMHNVIGSVLLQSWNSWLFCQGPAVSSLSSALHQQKRLFISERKLDHYKWMNILIGLVPCWFLTITGFIFIFITPFCPTHVTSKFPLGPKCILFFFFYHFLQSVGIFLSDIVWTLVTNPPFCIFPQREVVSE